MTKILFFLEKEHEQKIIVAHTHTMEVLGLYTDGTAEGFCTLDSTEVPGILAKHGVCVLLNVLSLEECSMMNDLAWSTFCNALQNTNKPLVRDDPSTYDAIKLLGGHHNMLFQSLGLGFGPHKAMLFNNKKAFAGFEAIYGTHKLHTSFDGCGFMPCGEIPISDKDYVKEWESIHLDQNLGKSRGKFEYVQSWVTGAHVPKEGATLQFLYKPGGGVHELHKAYGDHLEREKGLKLGNKDWVKMPGMMEWYKEQGCDVRRMMMPAGAQVFWDSRVPHSGVKGRGTHFRNVCYICAVPASRSTPALLAKRREILLEMDSRNFLRACSHQPDKMRLFSVYPVTRPYLTVEATKAKYADIAWPSMPELNDYGKRVCGLVPWS